MKTSNPALNLDLVKKVVPVTSSQVMTIDGTVNKTAILLILLVASAGCVWSLGPAGMALAVVGAIGGLIVSLVTVFKKEWSGVTAPLYAVLEGLFIGGISAWFEAQFPGLVMQAVSLTFGVLFAMLMAYKFGIIRVTDQFKSGVIAATMGLFFVYLLGFILQLVGFPLAFINGGGFIGILFSVFVVGLAALNLVLDFDFIQSGAKERFPQYMEWYFSFALMVTLVWLYIELLRLLSKLRSRD